MANLTIRRLAETLKHLKKRCLLNVNIVKGKVRGLKVR